MKKFKKHSYGFFSSKNWWEKAEKEIKYNLAFRFVPTQCGLENFKQIAKKIQRIIKYNYNSISSQNKEGNAEKGIK